MKFPRSRTSSSALKIFVEREVTKQLLVVLLGDLPLDRLRSTFAGSDALEALLTRLRDANGPTDPTPLDLDWDSGPFAELTEALLMFFARIMHTEPMSDVVSLTSIEDGEVLLPVDKELLRLTEQAVLLAAPRANEVQRDSEWSSQIQKSVTDFYLEWLFQKIVSSAGEKRTERTTRLIVQLALSALHSAVVLGAKNPTPDDVDDAVRGQLALMSVDSAVELRSRAQWAVGLIAGDAADTARGAVYVLEESVLEQASTPLFSEDVATLNLIVAADLAKSRTTAGFRRLMDSLIGEEKEWELRVRLQGSVPSPVPALEPLRLTIEAGDPAKAYLTGKEFARSSAAAQTRFRARAMLALDIFEYLENMPIAVTLSDTTEVRVSGTERWSANFSASAKPWLSDRSGAMSKFVAHVAQLADDPRPIAKAVLQGIRLRAAARRSRDPEAGLPLLWTVLELLATSNRSLSADIALYSVALRAGTTINHLRGEDRRRTLSSELSARESELDRLFEVYRNRSHFNASTIMRAERTWARAFDTLLEYSGDAISVGLHMATVSSEQDASAPFDTVASAIRVLRARMNEDPKE